MDITIIRTYFPGGTNGNLKVSNLQVPLYTIELPWLQNQHGISCVPEGQYRLEKRYSPRHKSHIILMGVKDRNLILVHPANDAMKELKGCIAPVSELTGEGKGTASVKAFNTLKSIVYAAMEKEPVYLTIKSK
jgi:hypothetical protein